jgi:hypothetical protein
VLDEEPSEEVVGDVLSAEVVPDDRPVEPAVEVVAVWEAPELE